MTKPTLLQRLFNAPSQSYSFPTQEKNYYSTKTTLLKIATKDELTASFLSSFSPLSTSNFLDASVKVFPYIIPFALNPDNLSPGPPQPFTSSHSR